MKKAIAIILMLALMINAIPTIALAQYTPPTVFGAPEDIAAEYREDGFEKTWLGFNVTASASDELRSFVDVVGADDSPFYGAGYNLSDILLQLDYKLDDGDWHYKNQWDEDLDRSPNVSMIRIEKGQYSATSVFNNSQFERISSGETLPVEQSYFDSRTMHFRARFIVIYQDSSGTYYEYASPWSQTISYSNNRKAEDPAALINHAPVLKSAELKKYEDGRPYLNLITDKAHEEVRHLDAISGNSVKTEFWLKAGSGDWDMCGTDNFVEEFNIGTEAYFGLKESYDEATYDIKFRYVFNYLYYPEAGKAGTIYSPFSNVISKGMPAYSAASNWAKTELDKAAGYDLIPESLKGADMTKPITREEFAEVAVKLYEKTTGTMAPAASSNPFTDTTNPEILKALKIGVTTGTSKTTFTPKALMDREQVATMLSRAIRIMAPDGDFSITGAPTFTDQKDISNWALEHVLYMAKSGIIKGADKKFMPKNITPAQIASGYANTTREMAILMSMRAYEQRKVNKPSSGVVPKSSNVSKEVPSPKREGIFRFSNCIFKMASDI